MTTHDPVWLQHMKTELLITAKSSVQFRKWTVDDGPVVWDSKRNLERKSLTTLTRMIVAGAAGTLRRLSRVHFEPFIRQAFRASIEFHGDAQYELGDLLPGVILRWKKNC